ncbi:hypothetical protein QTJ16_006208 [Diplocarpon rosae]|uniref:DNA-directed RNA polymerase III subunit RPC3 n=1 Tax=Diplocarpon rosae TaxID=946125 RepID=A0AAD9WBM4_9HELO|nr:hypothetical protein QTJ16_006208 [Diplocarpon rosae]PBP23924.1 DNA-directed RNA polymerase III subunit rpc3 [Diplocarpon rosae]
MSRSKNSVELCALLVDETYGELTSRIFTVLLRRGRLAIKHISNHTKISPRAVRHGLTVLIQQGLVFHNLDADGITFYEANHDAAYGLARSGKILQSVESRFGSFARDVMQNLFLMGHTKISDLAAVYESVPAHISSPAPHSKTIHPNGKSKTNGYAATNGVNGQSTEHPSTGSLHTVLAHLLEAGIIEPVVDSMFRSPTDLYNKIEKEVTNTVFGGGTKGVKQKEELKVKIQQRLESIRTEGLQWQPQGKKRFATGSHNGANGSHKRRRFSNGDHVTNGDRSYEDDGTRIDLNLIVRINYEKCTVALRNQALVTFANDRIGETTSLIYAQGLRILEDKIPRCHSHSHGEDFPDGPSFTTMQLTDALSKSLDPGMGIGKTETTKDGKKGRPKGEEDAVNLDEAESDGDSAVKGKPPEEDDPFADDLSRPAKRQKVTFQDTPAVGETHERSENRMQQVKNHLQLLESDDCHFLRKCGNSGQGEWTVDFDRIIALLQESEIDNMLLENFGTFGHRLARILRKFGKLDEKQLPTLALMKQKDVRTKMAEMQMAGMVDVQEVPRDAARNSNPGRTIFLWFFDGQRVASVMLENTYKMMSRCLQRLDVERRKAADILVVTQRTDIQHQRPDEYLDAAQMNALQIFRTKEEALLGQVHRLDQLIGIFRDF